MLWTDLYVEAAMPSTPLMGSGVFLCADVIQACVDTGPVEGFPCHPQQCWSSIGDIHIFELLDPPITCRWFARVIRHGYQPDSDERLTWSLILNGDVHMLWL